MAAACRGGGDRPAFWAAVGGGAEIIAAVGTASLVRSGLLLSQVCEREKEEDNEGEGGCCNHFDSYDANKPRRMPTTTTTVTSRRTTLWLRSGFLSGCWITWTSMPVPPGMHFTYGLAQAIAARLAAKSRGRDTWAGMPVIRAGWTQTFPTAPRYAKSKRSRFITLVQAATKSWTNFFCASALA